MIKDDLYNTNIIVEPREADSLHSQNCKMGQKAGSFYGMKNKGPGRDKYKVSCFNLGSYTSYLKFQQPALNTTSPLCSYHCSPSSADFL